MKKKKKKIKKPTKVTYPTKLNREDYFKCPVWFADVPRFVDDLNKASDPYIEISKKNLKSSYSECLWLIERFAKTPISSSKCKYYECSFAISNIRHIY